MKALDIFSILNVSLPKKEMSKLDKERYIDRIVDISSALIRNCNRPNVEKFKEDIVCQAIEIVDCIMSKIEKHDINNCHRSI